MNPPAFAWRSAAATLALTFASLASGEPVPLMNPGFEDGQAGWKFADKGISKVLPEAAHSGKTGLRIDDESPDLGSDVSCARFATEPGKVIKARCWARLIEGGGVGIFLRCFKGDGTMLNTRDLNNEIKVIVPDSTRDWTKFEVTGTAPEEAIECDIWIRSWSHAIVRAEIDDFELEQATP